MMPSDPDPAPERTGQALGWAACAALVRLLPGLLLAVLITGAAGAAWALRAQTPEAEGWLSGASYFRSPVADPREPRTGLAFFTTNIFDPESTSGERPPIDVPIEGGADRERQADAMLGGRFTIWQGRLTRELGVSLGFQGGVTARFRLDTSANDLLGTDWTVALPVEAARGRWSARARLLHWSSHLGDELAETTGARRIKFTHEAVDLLAAFRPLPRLRVYGGGSRVLRSQLVDEEIFLNGERVSDEGHVQLGAEARLPAAPARGISALAGLDLKKEDRSGWQTQVSLVGGVEAQRGDQRVRLLGRVFDGPSPMGQFFLSDERVYGVEIAVRW